MKIVHFFIIAIVAMQLVSCQNSPSHQPNSKQLTKVSLRQEWFASMSYFGDVIAINETDSIYGLDINLIAGADDVDPIKMVLSGTDMFGVCGADRIISSNEKGADLVVIGAVNYKNPTCFIAKKEKNILIPKDFEGRTVGVFTGNNTEMIYRALMDTLHLDKSKIKEVEAPFDLGSFIADAYDVRPAYIFDEPVSLDKQNIEYTIIKPEDYGVQFVGTVYFTSKATIQQQPELVQAFINAVAEGWKQALLDPNKSCKYLKKYDTTIDEKREQNGFQKGMEYFKGEEGKVLTVSKQRWQDMAKILIKLGIVKKFDESTLDNRFIEKYHLSQPN